MARAKRHPNTPVRARMRGVTIEFIGGVVAFEYHVKPRDLTDEECRRIATAVHYCRKTWR